MLEVGQQTAQGAPFVADQRARILALPEIDGAFIDSHEIGKAYGTAMALIVLQMPKRYLPIFQR